MVNLTPQALTLGTKDPNAIRSTRSGFQYSIHRVTVSRRGGVLSRIHKTRAVRRDANHILPAEIRLRLYLIAAERPIVFSMEEYGLLRLVEEQHDTRRRQGGTYQQPSTGVLRNSRHLLPAAPVMVAYTSINNLPITHAAQESIRNAISYRDERWPPALDRGLLDIPIYAQEFTAERQKLALRNCLIVFHVDGGAANATLCGMNPCLQRFRQDIRHAFFFVHVESLRGWIRARQTQLLPNIAVQPMPAHQAATNNAPELAASRILAVLDGNAALDSITIHIHFRPISHAGILGATLTSLISQADWFMTDICNIINAARQAANMIPSMANIPPAHPGHWATPTVDYITVQWTFLYRTNISHPTLLGYQRYQSQYMLVKRADGSMDWKRDRPPTDCGFHCQRDLPPLPAPVAV